MYQCNRDGYTWIVSIKLPYVNTIYGYISGVWINRIYSNYARIDFHDTVKSQALVSFNKYMP